MSTTATAFRPASWEDARGADGPKVVAYLEEHDLVTTLSFDEAIARAIRRWRSGCVAEFHTLDRALCRVGVHPSELPGEVWMSRCRSRPGEGGTQK